MPDASTPMMKQYREMKRRNPDCLLFFRLGDFYEMFNEDAKIGAKELDLALTTRDRGKPKEEQTPMCGVPYHAAQAYIARLIAKGYKVAICEQMEDPAQAKGLVDRDIIRVVTPGTVIDETMLDEGRNNFICSICLNSAAAGVCFCDISTGECFATAFSGADLPGRLINETGRFFPREAVLSDGAWNESALVRFLQDKLDCRCENGGEARFRPDVAADLADRQFHERIGSLDECEQEAIQAAGALLSYLHETQKMDLSYLSTLTFYTGGQFMELDLTARRNLELTETLRSKEKKGSLLWALDKTKTAMGRRLIRGWLERPLLSPAQIDRRLDAVDELFRDSIGRDEVVLCLREITDLERLISRSAYGTAGARDLLSLAKGLDRLPALQGLLAGYSSPLLTALRQDLDGLPDLCAAIFDTLKDDPPLTLREGGLIREGRDSEVDRLRSIQDNGAAMVASIEARERERTGIKSLKVRFNKVFGYYIEVSKSNYDLVPEDYIRKQTLANCERFITQELKDLEQEILSAKDRIATLEYELFCQLRQQCADRAETVQRAASAVAQVDVLASFAAVAAANRYCRPTVDLSDTLEITEGRHPVVEQMLKDSLFVPNDVFLDCGGSRLAIITGPNMAGKSTYMRQVALITLMAQMGSFVPAKAARIGIVDRVFTRIGASDDLSAGASTFMVEMNEVAELLKHATAKSLLILDEIGRGTSTYDGMAIARAVLEYCADQKRLGCKTLFATHYHELTALEGVLPGVKNYNVAAKKRKDDIVFLRKIVPGGAAASYGIEVAKLAGVPDQVLERAREILRELEAQGWVPAAPAAPAEAESGQIALEDLGSAEVADVLRRTSVETLTPLEALNLLYELKQKL